MKKIIKSFKMRPDIKVMFIGDHDTGKTCNLISYCTNSFTEENDIDLYENSNKNIKINSKDYSVYLRDTYPDPNYDHRRLLSYPDTDVFVICYDVQNESSLENIKSKWIPEISYHCPNTPYLIVANKIDLRENDDLIQILKEKERTMVTYETGYNFAIKNGSKYYCECSAKTQEGLKNVYETIIKMYEEKQIKNDPQKNKNSLFSSVTNSDDISDDIDQL
jgi:small GTP-binding protein